MTPPFLQKIILSKSLKDNSHSDENEQTRKSGYFMMQAVIAADKQKFKAFYAVPEFMREQVNKDKSVLEKSTNISNLYEVEHSEYLQNTDTHNKKAETEFLNLKTMHKKVANSFKNKNTPAHEAEQLER